MRGNTAPLPYQREGLILVGPIRTSFAAVSKQTSNPKGKAKLGTQLDINCLKQAVWRGQQSCKSIQAASFLLATFTSLSGPQPLKSCQQPIQAVRENTSAERFAMIAGARTCRWVLGKATSTSVEHGDCSLRSMLACIWATEGPGTTEPPGW